MQRRIRLPLDVPSFLATVGGAGTIVQFRKNQNIFAQGDSANAVFYIQKGRVKLTVASEPGKEAVGAMLGAGDFLGEGCIAGQHLRMATAAAMGASSLLKIERNQMM